MADETKNFALSRRVQGSSALVAAAATQAEPVRQALAALAPLLGLGAEDVGLLQNGVSAVLALVAVVRWALHFMRPDDRSLTLGAQQ